MNNNFRIFLLFSKNAIRTSLQGRVGVVFFTLGKMLRFVLTLFFLMFIFQRTRVLQGYSFEQAVLFYMVFTIVDTSAQIVFREVYRFRWLVSSGALDTVLLKPYHPFMRVLVGGVDILDVFLLIPYLGYTFYLVFHIGTTPLQLVGFGMLLINALWISTSFHIIVLAFGILSTEVDHSIMIYRDITSLGRFPLDIYKEPFKSIFTFVVPVGVMTAFPPQALFGLLSPIGYISAFVLSSILFLVAMRFWKYALEKYQSWGG
jgi:ABC-2 type transport system permease protein